MKVGCFEDTHGLYIEIQAIRDLDENTLFVANERGRALALTIHHAPDRVDPGAVLRELAGT